MNRSNPTGALETAAAETLDGSESRRYWTTVNANEALPGVTTPLNWSFYDDAAEAMLRGTFHALGALSTTAPGTTQDDRLMAVFYGRCVLNVDLWREIADRIPGNSGDALERQFFGSVRPGVTSNPTRRRYAAEAARYPKVALTVRKQVQRNRHETFLWWRSSVQAIEAGGLPAALTKLRESPAKFTGVGIPHTVCSMITQGLFQQIATLAEKAGHPGLEASLATGYGSEETVALEKLWDVSRGRGPATVDQIVAEHGFTAPGEVSARAWREDPDTVRAVIERYRGLPEDRSPAAAVEAQRRARLDAVARLNASLGPVGRLKARILLRAASRVIPAREYGRAAVLMTVDVARAAAREAGRHYVAQGVLDGPEDVFFLTIDELSDPPPDARTLVVRRRARSDWYRSLVLPEAWTGRPEPVAADVPGGPDGPGRGSSGAEVLHGVGVSPGRVTGVAQVVTDPFTADFADDQILVCPATDPAWASLFLSAAGVVIDIGGPMSHGAIVARELGVPCVANTKTGTRRIRSGDLLEVDGDTGRVTITPIRTKDSA